jgi:pimeloyl-ACP methyl ester carboxylesterase
MAGQRNHDIPARVRDEFGPDLVAEFIDRCHARTLDPDVRDTLIQRALDGVPQRYLDAFASIRQIDLRPDLATISCPTLVIRRPRDCPRTPPNSSPESPEAN